LQKYKNQIEAINSRILHYETEIVDYQRDVRDKMAEIRELKQTI
jgi:predicted  nucleic acid-binding Zn-ribbon protein